MVLKRPYGLLIKHFRLIHIILTILSILIVVNVNEIVVFYRNFVSNNYTATITENMARNYISPILYLYLIISIAILLAVYILLRYKKKANKFYLMAIIYYVLLIILIIVSEYLFNSLEEALWATKSARLYRDIAQVVYLPQYAFIVMLVIRSLGFNVKQFNFKDDLREMELTDEDSEEIEINLGFNTYKTERTIRRLIREFKYYFLENKFIFICIIVAISLFLLYYIFTNFEIYTYKYKTGESFSYDGLNYVIEDSIITNLNYAGEMLDQDNYYLLLKFKVSNNSKEVKKINYSKFLIYQNKDYYQPSIDMGSNFIDYAKPYYGENIASGTSHTYLLAYSIPKSIIKNNFKLELFTGYTLKKLDFKSKKIKIKLSPLLITDVKLVQSIGLNTNLSFNGTYLDNTSIMVKSALSTTKYTYQYENCSTGKCRNFTDIVLPNYRTSSKKALLVLDCDFEIDQNVPYYKSNQSLGSFANNFFKIRYIYNGSVYVDDLVDVTPTNLKDKIVMQTSHNIVEATKMELLITIRNKSYVINLSEE